MQVKWENILEKHPKHIKHGLIPPQVLYGYTLVSLFPLGTQLCPLNGLRTHRKWLRRFTSKCGYTYAMWN